MDSHVGNAANLVKHPRTGKKRPLNSKFGAKFLACGRKPEQSTGGGPKLHMGHL